MMNIFKKPLIFIPLLLLVLVVIVFVFLTREGTKPLTPDTAKGPINSRVYESIETGAIGYSGPTLSNPDRLGVYKNEGESLEETAPKIAAKLNLKISSFSKNTWISDDQKSYLSLDPFNHYLEYSLDQGEVGNIETRPTLSVSVASALNFLSTLELTSTINEEPKKVVYYQRGEFVETSQDKAEVIEMHFEQGMGGLPVSVDSFSFSEIVVRTSASNVVIKAIFPPQLVPSQVVSEHPLIDFKDAVASIEAKRGNIIEVRTQEQGKLVENVNLGEINLTQSVLEYRLSITENLFYPYWRFEGVATLKSGELEGKPAFVTIIAPAIETE